jgi:pimeloyl-ACP methyl ester carboxylesterase
MVTTDGTPLGELALNVFRGPENGPPLIFLHGVLRSWQDLRPLIPYFSFEWTCYAVDHRGHGGSDRGNDNYTVVDYVGDIVQFVTTQFDEPIVLYGHSLGAMVVAGVAAELGDRVAGIIMEDPPFETMGSRIHKTPLLGYFESIQRVRQQFSAPEDILPALSEILIIHPITGEQQRLSETRDEAALLFAAKCLSKVDPSVFAPIVQSRWLEGFNYLDVTHSLSCPGLLLQADPACGGMLTDEDVAAMKSIKKNLFHVKFPGGSHLLHWAKRDPVLSAVTAFLANP